MGMEKHGGMILTAGKPVIRPPGLSGNPTSSHLVLKKEELAKAMINLAL
jgi:hypothetical protein